MNRRDFTAKAALAGLAIPVTAKSQAVELFVSVNNQDRKSVV